MKQLLGATILPVIAAMTLPIWMMKLNYTVDNPWGIGLSKAQKTGLVLADSLISNYQENRPITLIGYSLGARVIYYCLKELADKNIYGVIEDVYLIGTPVVESSKDWAQCASVVSNRFVNGYITNDWVLGFLYRASSGSIQSIAGLSPIKDVPKIENICLDGIVNGHLDYRRKIPLILKYFGLKVTSDAFETEEESDEKERKSREEGVKLEKEMEKNEKENKHELKNDNDNHQNGLTSTQPMSMHESNMNKNGSENGGFKKFGNWFKSFSNSPSVSSLNSETYRTAEEELIEIEKEEALERERLKKELEKFLKPEEKEKAIPEMVLQPKEIKSTLPKLVLDSKNEPIIEKSYEMNSNEDIENGKESMYSSSTSIINNKDLEIKQVENSNLIPKEIKSTMPTLVVGPKEIKSTMPTLVVNLDEKKNNEEVLDTNNQNNINKEEEKTDDLLIKQLPSTQPTLKISLDKTNEIKKSKKSKRFSYSDYQSEISSINSIKNKKNRNRLSLSLSVPNLNRSDTMNDFSNLDRLGIVGEEKLTAPTSPSYLPELYSQIHESAKITDTNLLFDYTLPDDDDDENDNKNIKSNLNNDESLDLPNNRHLIENEEEKKYKAFEKARQEREARIEAEKLRKLQEYERKSNLENINQLE